jgi:hypothetical protein
MVICIPKTRKRRSRGGWLMLELLAAIMLLVGALFPLAYSLGSERRLARSSYQHAAAMEIVDGEMELLAAGEWRSFKPGTQEYPVNSGAARNLPPGKFLLTIFSNRVQLLWQPSVKHQGGPVMREVTVQ